MDFSHIAVFAAKPKNFLPASVLGGLPPRFFLPKKELEFLAQKPLSWQCGPKPQERRPTMVLGQEITQAEFARHCRTLCAEYGKPRVHNHNLFAWPRCPIVLRWFSGIAYGLLVIVTETGD